MQYKVLGRRSGLRVSNLALGAGNFGTAWGYGAQPVEARRMFDVYAEAGGNFIDTSDNYQFGESETIVGDLIASDRDHFVLATKFTQGAAPTPRVSQTGNSRRNMVRSVEASLKRLKTDRIDLYWAHMPDGITPLEEILRGFDDLVRSGKILYAGLSNFPAWKVAYASAVCELRGWAPLVAIQVEYSLVERTADRELLPMASELGLGVAGWSPLGGGLLTGKYRESAEGRASTLGVLVHTEGSQRETGILDVLLYVAREAGRSPLEVALAWLRVREESANVSLVPILGPKSEQQLIQCLACLDYTLDPSHAALLDEVSRVPLGVPHEMIGSERYLHKLTGGHLELLRR